MGVILCIFLSAFASAVGFFIGSGNYKGLSGALVPGVVAGLLIGIPSGRQGDWLSVSILVIGAVLGSIIVALTPDGNRLKRLCREQRGLKLRIGAYRLGRG